MTVLLEVLLLAFLIFCAVAAILCRRLVSSVIIFMAYSAVMLLCLIRAVRGPRYTDRLAALNLICTVVVLMVCILSYVLGASYLVDVAILYGLLNLLAVAVLSRISVRRHRERRRGKKS